MPVVLALVLLMWMGAVAPSPPTAQDCLGLAAGDIYSSQAHRCTSWQMEHLPK